MSKKDTLLEAVKQLAELKAEAAQLNNELKAEVDNLIATHRVQNKERYDRLDELQVNIEALTNAVKEEAIKRYEATGEKKPAPGIGIRIVRKLSYSEADAIRWAMSIGKPEKYLSVKKRAFEKVAKAVEPDFVTIREERQVTFATDLLAAVKGVDNE